MLLLCPVGHDGRRMYDREFLIKFKELCREKPSLEHSQDLLMIDFSRGPQMGGGGGGGFYGKNERRVCSSSSSSNQYQ